MFKIYRSAYEQYDFQVTGGHGFNILTQKNFFREMRTDLTVCTSNRMFSSAINNKFDKW